MMSCAMQRVVREEMSAIRLFRAAESPGLYRFPAGAMIVMRGKSRLQGMMEVEWQEEVYAVFEADLYARTVDPDKRDEKRHSAADGRD
jgi:hypothetical protein